MRVTSLITNWSMACSFSRSSGHSTCYHVRRQPIAFVSALPPISVMTQTRALCSLASATSSKENDKNEPGPISWRARQDCWRPDVRDVEKISFGMPAKKKKTGSRGVPHRLNDDERRSFDQARRQGFLQVTGSSWRSQRRDAPLMNSYRSLMDARGTPMIVLHKLSPNSSGGVDNGDRLVVDLSPLRFPDEFEKVGQEIKKILIAEFDVESQITESVVEDKVEMDGSTEILDNNKNDDDWEMRPIYQLSPHFLSWEVSRHQGKQIGKFLGSMFKVVEEKATKTRKPKGIKPGKGRRHGGYGIG